MRDAATTGVEGLVNAMPEDCVMRPVKLMDGNAAAYAAQPVVTVSETVIAAAENVSVSRAVTRNTAGVTGAEGLARVMTGRSAMSSIFVWRLKTAAKPAILRDICAEKFAAIAAGYVEKQKFANPESVFVSPVVEVKVAETMAARAPAAIVTAQSLALMGGVSASHSVEENIAETMAAAEAAVIVMPEATVWKVAVACRIATEPIAWTMVAAAIARVGMA